MTGISDRSTLVQQWLSLWNGEQPRASDFISPQFHIHAALLDGSDSGALRGPHGLLGWIRQIRATMPDLLFQIEVGPIVQGDLLALRWTADGHYAGGFPGAAAAVGTPIHFTGTDLLRVQGEQLAEYWVNSDMHVLLAQLGVRPT